MISKWKLKLKRKISKASFCEVSGFRPRLRLLWWFSHRLPDQFFHQHHAPVLRRHPPSAHIPKHLPCSRLLCGNLPRLLFWSKLNLQQSVLSTFEDLALLPPSSPFWLSAWQIFMFGFMLADKKISAIRTLSSGNLYCMEDKTSTKPM